MLSICQVRIAFFAFLILGALSCANGNAQAALLMEEPYGFFGTVNPTGHNAIYFERICAETPVKLRRCQPGEMGAVIARYQGIAGYDWVAIPLIPYLYSVEIRRRRSLARRPRDGHSVAQPLSRGASPEPGSESVAGQSGARRLDSTGGRGI